MVRCRACSNWRGAFSSQAKQANAPITSTVALHGNRMVRSNPHSTEIIDLDQQTITSIDHDKRSYSVVTFQQMQQAMADAAAKARAQNKNSTDSNTSNNAQMSFNAHVSSNGATRTIDGRAAKEALLSVTMIANANDGSNAKGGMAATSEMWLVSDVPGEEELRAFNQRMAKELAMDTNASQMSGLLSAQPGGAQALADLKKEAAKMRGVPVLKVTRVGVSADGQPLPAPSVAPVAHTKSGGSGAGKVTGEVATDSFRHSLATNLRSLGVDIKVAQELMRYSSCRTTLDVYTRAVDQQKREASVKIVELMLPLDMEKFRHPSAPSAQLKAVG